MQAQEDEYLVSIVKEHKANVLSVAFSPDGHYLVSGSEDKVLLIYDLTMQEPKVKFDNNYFPPRAIIVTQVNNIFLGAGSDIKMIDFNNKTLAVYKGNSTHIWSIGYAPERNKLVAGSYDYTIKVWDVATEESELQLEGHKKSTLPVAFSPDEKYIVSGSLDRTVKVWNAKTGELMKTLERHTDNIYDIAFHPTGKYFASASRDKTIRLWDFETGEVVKTYIGHDKGILDIEFTPDGNHLLSASFDGSIRLWQTKTGKMVYTFSDHEGIVNSIDVNHDGTMLASGGADTKVILWKLAKKIFVEYAFYNEFHNELESSSIFDLRRKGEKKEDYEKRRKKAELKEAEIVERYYTKYREEIRNQSF
jgi:WD40 repeat protein